MDLKFRIADLRGAGSRLEQEGPQAAPEALEVEDSSGQTRPFEVGPERVGLLSHLIAYADRFADDGAKYITIPEKILNKSPTDRVLDACDSYAASLRSMAPTRVMDTLLTYPDPKIGVFHGGLRDEEGQFKTYRVVGKDGNLEERTATYDGSKIYLYLPANEARVIARLRELQERNPRYESIELVPFPLGGLSSPARRLESRFDRPGILWVSSRCPLLPQVKDDNYLVPGSRFAVEVYYHDGRINAPGARNTIESLLERGDPSSRRKAGKVLSALRGTTNVFVNQINTLGKVLNANLTLYAGRTQPPSLTRCIRETYESWKLLHGDNVQEMERARVWLRWATEAAVREYEDVWLSEPRYDPVTGLSRYVDETPTESPEEPGSHYAGMEWDAEAIQSDAAVREHGWDSHVGALSLVGETAGRPVQHRMIPVCLNSVLYTVEKDLAALHIELGHGSAAEKYEAAAQKRKETINRLMWSSKTQLYSDLIYDPDDPDRDLSGYQKNEYEDLRGYLPMWAGIVEPGSWRADAMHSRIVDFERAGGLATATKESWMKAVDLNANYVERCQWGQWDIGWPIATYETIEGLRKMGYDEDADRLAYRWCWTVQREMERGGGLRFSSRGGLEGPVTEKLDVDWQSLGGSAEMYGYGNQGRGQDGNGSGFRWGYDAFKLLVRSLDPGLRSALAKQIYPDVIFANKGTPPIPQSAHKLASG